ncbi:hypothetical protein [Chitinophaga sp. S165]|uniref:hypothetical protein n=1 Tax=Chitinophaga sp. S165 TaxID=2135462 RepID=UPI000D71846D|nr:hypothetical protein [Chitinophaga sp. S165]PWV46112.1 hypothetical protein C7475_11114 [Chitinophaga sp. S165]
MKVFPTAASGTVIPGMGAFDDGDYITPFIRKGFDDRIFDHVVKTSKDAAALGTKDLKEAGIFCGPQTGGLLAAVVELVRQGILTGDIVLISGDAGWKNLDKLSVGH